MEGPFLSQSHRDVVVRALVTAWVQMKDFAWLKWVVCARRARSVLIPCGPSCWWSPAACFLPCAQTPWLPVGPVSAAQPLWLWGVNRPIQLLHHLPSLQKDTELLQLNTKWSYIIWTGLPQIWECHFVIIAVINVSPQKTITSDSIIQPSYDIYILVITFLLISQQFRVDVGEPCASRAWVDGVIYMLSATGLNF